MITQLEQESARGDAQANNMAELLFAQLVLILHRHRYATDNRAATQSETLLDKLLTELAGSLNRPLFSSCFASRKGAASVRCVSSFASRPG